MWPYMLSALALGTRLIAFDGSPFHPDVREFLKFVSKEQYVSASQMEEVCLQKRLG